MARTMISIALLSFLFARKPKRDDVEIAPLAEVKEDLVVNGRLVVGDGAVLHGKVEATGPVRLGRRVRVKGALRAGGPLQVGRGSTLEQGFAAEEGAEFEGAATVAPPAPPPAPAPQPAPSAPERATGDRRLVLKDIVVDVPTRHADELLAAFRAVGWHCEDTGRTVATDEDEESLTSLHLDVLLPARYSPFSLPNDPSRAAPSAAPAPSARPPAALRGIVFAAGDLYVGEGVETDLALSASGRIIIGPNACVSGLVRSQGDLIIAENASIGDALCAGTLTLEEGATVGNLVEADGGVTGPGAEAPVPAPAIRRAGGKVEAG